jgi:hypothetical protein
LKGLNPFLISCIGEKIFIINKFFSFVANYDANVQAILRGLQITLAEPRRKGDEVSLLSTEVHFQTVESRPNERLKGLKSKKGVFKSK